MWRFAAILVAFGMLTATEMASAQGKIGGKTTEEWITLLHGKEKSDKRQAAVIILELIGPGDILILPALIETLKTDTDVDVRTAVAQALGRMGPKGKESDAKKVAVALTKTL